MNHSSVKFPYYYRPHRGGLQESLSEQVLISTEEELVKLIIGLVVIIQPYGFDYRIGQYAWIVRTDCGVMGFITQNKAEFNPNATPSDYYKVESMPHY